ncbi:MAG: hypothetical protein ACREJU_20825, partial [Nitrospiraceae bacterium]
PIVPWPSSLRRDHLEPLLPAERIFVNGPSPLNENQARQQRLIAAAIRAPSGDNCQPWCFRFEGTRQIFIHTVPERAESFFDYGSCATFLSVGAVIENMRLQAASEGWGIRVAYESGAGTRPLAAAVQLVPDRPSVVPPDRVEAMLRRTVNRRPFLPWRLSPFLLAQLSGDPVDMTGIRIISRRSDISRWARVIELGDRVRFSHPRIHEELFAKLLFHRKTAERVRIGLEVDRLGMGPLAGPLLTWLRPWDRVTTLSRWGLITMLAGQSRLLALATGALGLVTIPNDGQETWIRAGEQVQRIWVRAHQLGLGIHPMTVALYLDRRYQEEGIKDFLPRHEQPLQELRRRLKELLPDAIGAMLFRIGKAWPIHDVAIRMPAEHFIMKESCEGSPRVHLDPRGR